MLSAAIMMRDEEGTILRTLSTVINHVDNIVVLDTGSVDDSVNIVKAFCKGRNVPLKLEEMEWSDFSTNRNHLLSMCEESLTEFSILLDANDEVKNIEVLVEFLKTIKDDKNQAMVSTRFCWENDNHIPGNSRQYYKPVVIRNNGAIRYKYPVHETLYLTKPGTYFHNRSLERSSFHVYQDRSKDKSSIPRIRDNDIPTILQYMEKEGESTRMLRYLCQSYDVIKDHKKLYYWSEKLINSETNPDVYDEDIYIGYIWHGRSASLLDKEFHASYIKALEYSKKCGAVNAEPLFELATVYMNKENYEMAYIWSLKCCEIECPPDTISGAAINYKLHKEIRWVLLHKLATIQKVEDDVKRALNELGKRDLSIILCGDSDNPVLIGTKANPGLEAGRKYQLEDLPDKYRAAICKAINKQPATKDISSAEFIDKTKGKKLYVLVRYRDRDAQLKKFIPQMTSYLTHANIEFEIWILEQTDDGPFHHGISYNVAAKLFEECDNYKDTYICFHDVDVLPTQGVNYYYPDENEVNHLHGNTFSLNMATVMRTEDFLRMNGVSNLYEHWGFDDNDMQRRVNYNKIVINRRYFSPRYSRHCFQEVDADKSAPVKKMLEDNTKVNFNIFRQNYDPQDDGYKQIKHWREYFTWMPWNKHYSHFHIDVAGIKKVNDLTACMQGYIPQPDDYPEGVLHGTPITLVERKWKEPV